MPTPWETTSLGGLRLKNRFVRSATWEGLAADDGSCTPELVNVIADLARGEIGLIISSHAYVSPAGQAGPRQIAICDDRFVDGIKKMVKAAHDPGSRIILQLAHAGIQATTSLTHREAVGPSELKKAVGQTRAGDDDRRRSNRPSTHSRTVPGEPRRLVSMGCRSMPPTATFCLNSFRPISTNAQTNTAAASRTGLASCWKSWSGSKLSPVMTIPVLIKMNSEDFLDDGFTVAEMLEVAARLEAAGIDGIELSGGVIDPACHYIPVREGTPLTEEEEAYYRQAARRYKERIGVPLILVGGIRSYTVSQELIEDGRADYIALSRPLIREPNLVARWKYGDTGKSECGSCNACFGPIRRGDGFYCEQRRSG